MAAMTKKTRIESIILVALLVLLAIVMLYMNRAREAAFAGIQIGDVSFQSLGVSNPALRMDLLDRIQKEEYKGEHRNIFSAAPLPSPVVRTAQSAPIVQPPVVPPPSGPPPLVIPATLFGMATEVSTGRRKAIFSGSENDVFIVAEGGTLLGQYRVTKIGNNSVDIEEISSGRKTTLTLASPADSSQPLQAQP
jgi:hypothetical protein